MDEQNNNGTVDELASKLEALLFISSEPVSFEELLKAFQVSDRELMEIIDRLSLRLRDSEGAIELRELADGFQLFTKESYFDFLDDYLSDDRKSRLSDASLETLAIVAYCQPVTRADVSKIRGVNSDSIISSLVNRSLIEQKKSDDALSAAELVTTDNFLNLLGIMEISELPDLEQFAPDEDTRLAIAEKISSLHEMQD